MMSSNFVRVGHSGRGPLIWLMDKVLQEMDEPSPLSHPSSGSFPNHEEEQKHSHVHQFRQIGPSWKYSADRVVIKVPV